MSAASSVNALLQIVMQNLRDMLVLALRWFDSF
jgi:hypothetical protein